MITAINSATNFKAVYVTAKEGMLTAAQERALEQIKAETNKVPMDDFLVTPIGTRHLDLARIYPYKTKENNLEKNVYNVDNSIHIGTYDIDHPFEIKDIDFAYEKRSKNQMKSTLIGGAYMLALFAGFLMLARGYSAKPKNVEKVTDTIATKVDTLKSAEILKP